MLYSVQHRFVQGHLPPLSIHIFWMMGLKGSKQPCAAYLMSSPGKVPCEMLPSCDNKPEQPNAAIFGWLAPLPFGFLGRCVPITSWGTVFKMCDFFPLSFIKLDLDASFELLGFFVIISGPERL